MTVVHSKSPGERVDVLFDTLMEKLVGVSGELRHALEKDLEELRGSVAGILYTRSEEESAARMKYLQAMLSESEARYRELGENMSDPLVIFGPDLRLIYRNPAAEQASQISNEIAMGKTFEELYPNMVGSELHQKYLDAVETGQTQSFVNHWICPDTGKDCYYEITFYPSRDWLVCISVNVTERMEALEALRLSEKFNRHLIESSSDSIKVLDLSGRLLSINSGGLRLLEAENANAVIGRNWVAFWQEEDRPRVQAAVDAACSGQVGAFQAPRRSFLGKELWWDVVISPIRGVDDQVERLLVVSRNITERKQAEDDLKHTSEILRESEGRFRAMADGTPVMIWVHNASGEIEFINKAWTDYFGPTLEEVKANGWTPLVHPDDVSGYVDVFRKCTEAHTFFHAQARVRTKDGTWHWIESQGQPRFSETGEFLGMAGSSIDITERVQAQAALLKSEEKFSRAFHSSPVAMAITRLVDGRYVDVNEHTCTLLGYTREEMLNKTTLELNIYKNEADRRKFLDLLLAQGRVVGNKQTIYNRAGKPITALLSFEKIEVDGEDCILATMNDITEQEQIEAEREALLEELRVQKDLLERLIEFSPIGISMLKGPEHRFVLVNPAQVALFPTIDRYIGRTPGEVWPESKDIVTPLLDNVFRTGKPFSATDVPWMTDKGSGPEEAFYSYSYTPLYAADGTIEGILVLSKETTEQVRIRQRLEEELEERKQVEIALSESEEKLRSAFENATIGFALTAADNHFIEANPAYCALTGYTLEELHDIPFQRLVHPDDLESNIQHNERLVAGEFDNYVIENRYVRKDGQTVWVKKNISLVRTIEGQPKWYIALVEDISERKRAEAALVQAHNDLINERSRLLAAMEALPVGLAIYNEKGGVIQANPGFEAVWGSPRPPANSVDDYEMYKAWWVQTGKRVQPEEWASAKSIVTGEPVIGQYLRILRFDGTYGYVMNSGAPVLDAEGKIIGGAVAIMDITERVEMEKALQESQNRFRVAMSSVPLLLYTCDRDLRTTWVYNPPKGYRVEDVLGKRADEVLPPEDVAALMAAKQQAIDTGQGGIHDIKMNLGGEERYYILTIDPIRNALGEVTGLTCASIDITDQKRMEIERQEVQMKIEVQRRLMDQREKERQGIARDIHDGPIQTLASTAFNIQFLKESFPDPTLAVELNQIALNVKSAVRELRDVVTDLRPPSIIRFGLNRAIMMHAEDMRERYPEIELELYLDEDGARLSDQACLTVFRVFQEGMNNIFRHAGATKVQVSYTVTETQFVLELRDNGRGFAVPKDYTNLTINGHYGLAGMKERVESVGGTFSIKSEPGKGATITVKGPLAGTNVK